MPVEVSIRAWVALCAMDMDKDGKLTVRQIRRVLTRRNPSDWGKDVPGQLLRHGVARHACRGAAHNLGLDCLLRITPAGARARLNSRGQKWLAKRHKDRV